MASPSRASDIPGTDDLSVVLTGSNDKFRSAVAEAFSGPPKSCEGKGRDISPPHVYSRPADDVHAIFCKPLTIGIVFTCHSRRERHVNNNRAT